MTLMNQLVGPWPGLLSLSGRLGLTCQNCWVLASPPTLKFFPTISGPGSNLLLVDDLAGLEGVESIFLLFSLATFFSACFPFFCLFANPVTETDVGSTRVLLEMPSSSGL